MKKYILLALLCACGKNVEKEKGAPEMPFDANAFDLEAVYSDGVEILGIDIDDPAKKLHPAFFLTPELSEADELLYAKNIVPPVGLLVKTSDENIKKIASFCNGEFIFCSLRVFVSENDIYHLQLSDENEAITWANELAK